MAAYNKFQCTVADLANKVHNLGSDTLKVALTNSAPVATNTVLANITQIAYTNLGGLTGGQTATLTSSSQTAGLYKLILQNAVFTATGAAGPFQYAVLYNSTAASGNLIAWFDYGSAVSMVNGDTFTVAFDGTNGVFQLT